MTGLHTHQDPPAHISSSSLPDHEYPYAHELREGLNRSRKRLEIQTRIQMALIFIATLFCLIALCL